ncbi:hypothetical protein ACFL5O_11150 [Myxococcota bacterium]
MTRKVSATAGCAMGWMLAVSMASCGDQAIIGRLVANAAEAGDDA